MEISKIAKFSYPISLGMSKALLKKHMTASSILPFLVCMHYLVLMAHYGFTIGNILYIYIYMHSHTHTHTHTHICMGTLKMDQQIQDVHGMFVGQFSSARNIQ
jgi:hypothetical protein